MIDYAVATGVSYINFKGIGKPDKSSKVDRYAEIFDHIRLNKYGNKSNDQAVTQN